MIDRLSSEGKYSRKLQLTETICVFYDMHSKPSVYSTMHTVVVNPLEVPITYESFSNDLALSTGIYFQKQKIFHYLR